MFEHIFDHCATPQDVKRLFSKLAKQYHPDMGGDNESMRLILAAYKARLSQMHGQTSTDERNETHTYHYNAARETEQARAAANAAALDTALIVEMVGTWVWITGNTRSNKDALKELGYKWHSKRKAWYWKPFSRRRQRYAEDKDLDDIRDMYGSQRVQHAPRPSLI